MCVMCVAHSDCLQQSSGDQTLTISGAKTSLVSQNSLLISRADNSGETYKPAAKSDWDWEQSKVLCSCSPPPWWLQLSG